MLGSKAHDGKKRVESFAPVWNANFHNFGTMKLGRRGRVTRGTFGGRGRQSNARRLMPGTESLSVWRVCLSVRMGADLIKAAAQGGLAEPCVGSLGPLAADD